MMFISRHITPLVINSLGRGHTHAHTQKRIPTIRTGSILRNQAQAGLWPARAWFKKFDLKNNLLLKIFLQIPEEIKIFYHENFHMKISNSEFFPKLWYTSLQCIHF